MSKMIQKTHPLIIFGTPLLILLSMVFLVNSPAFQQNSSQLSVGVTLDLILTIPIVYFLLIWKTKISKITVLSTFIIGVLTASYLLPAEHQGFLDLVKTFAVPVAEVGLLLFLVISFRKTVKQYKIEKGQALDFFSALTRSADKMLPQPFGYVLATEVAVAYYGLFKLPKKERTALEYTYFEKSGIRLVLYTFIGIIGIETFAVHLLAEQWSTTLAWVLTGLSIYTCFQVFALTRSMPQRLTTIDLEEQKLHLRYGFFCEATIDLQDIASIELTGRTLPKRDGLVVFSPIDLLDSHNLVLTCKNEQTMRGFYGRRKTFDGLYLYIDDKVGFKAAIEDFIGR